MLGESATVNPKTEVDWKSEELPKIINAYLSKDVFNVDESGLFYNLHPSRTLTYKGDSYHGGTKSKQRVTVLLGCNDDGTEKLPALVIGKYNITYCCRNVKNLPTKYTANSNSWMTSATVEEFLMHFDHQIGAKNRKILLFIDQCAAHPRDTIALKNIKVKFFPLNCTSHFQSLDMGIIHAFKCKYRKHIIRKAVGMINGELHGDSSKMKVNVLTALHFITEAWRHNISHHRKLLQEVWFYIRW